MSRGVRRIAFVVVVLGVGIGASVACSFTTDLGGFSLRDEAETGTFVEASADAPADAALPDVVEASATCKPKTVIDTPLTSTLGSWSPRSYRQTAGYPKVEKLFGMPAAVLLPFVDTTPIPIDAGNPDAGPTFYNPPERTDAVGSLWQTNVVPLRSFDVEMEIFVRCTSGSSCADGFGFAWLDTTVVAPLDATNYGHVMGLPRGVSGGAVIADDYQNGPDFTSDPPAPALEIAKIDGTKSPGYYPWVVGSKPTSFLAAWHKVSISVRADAVTVSYDGALAVTGVVPSVKSGLVTIAAGTGGQTDAVAVRNVKASFYDCVP